MKNQRRANTRLDRDGRDPQQQSAYREMLANLAMRERRLPEKLRKHFQRQGARQVWISLIPKREAA
jgi:hypothetical protein